MHAVVVPERLTWWERCVLVLLALGAVLLGTLVEIRSVFLQRRMTDLQVYLRAAWAVTAGENLYHVTDDNNWHYLYPPLLAIALVPLQAPPPTAASTGWVPYAVSVVLWYVLSIALLLLGVHLLAGALEKTSANSELHAQPYWCRGWWQLRLFSVLACLPAVGVTLARGQVGMLILFLFCAMIAAYLRGRRRSTGLWLAASICLKLIPAFLLVLPLLRRDGRALLSCVLGMFLGFVVVPVAALGPSRAGECYHSWAQIFLLPALGQSDDRSCAKEILEATATHSQSPLIILHNTMYPEFATRPKEVAPWVKGVHLLVSGLLTVLVILPALRRRIEGGPALLMFAGSLILVMTQISPVCHQHYFVWSVPLLMGIQAALWEKNGYSSRLSSGLWALLVVNMAANGLPLIPGLTILRELGLPMYGAWLLLILANVLLWRQPRLRPSTPLLAQPPRTAHAA